ncbi:hypothetical protein DKG34_08000 [Streptomyces sp. NWU49]|uniref:hypothetical protein n=1 Tax=Streptomyces sp. NWU49 TaxID=2201153 RepID=UPI000D680644|nr:hypothetical protein [Streptomyces sp. NWU49]PWJ08418.1 hypothetical protein DKG34_08000 [Streptomyces sp. NWU49]
MLRHTIDRPRVAVAVSAAVVAEDDTAAREPAADYGLWARGIREERRRRWVGTSRPRRRANVRTIRG